MDDLQAFMLTQRLLWSQILGMEKALGDAQKRISELEAQLKAASKEA